MAAATIVLMAGCAGEGGGQGGDSVGVDQTQALVETELTRTGVPSISLAVATADGRIHSFVAGVSDRASGRPATADTQYLTYSISKSVTSIALHQLIEQGKVDLDDDIGSYVPSYPPRSKPITLRHLLTNTSGIRQFRAEDAEIAATRTFPSLEEAIGLFREDPLEFSPGTDYEYTSLGFNLLSGVIESITKESFSDYLRSEVFEPFQLSHTDLLTGSHSASLATPYRNTGSGNRLERIDPLPNLSWCFASAGVVSTPTDLVRLLRTLRSSSISSATRTARPPQTQRVAHPPQTLRRESHWLEPETVDSMFRIGFPELNATQALGFNRDTDAEGRLRIYQSGRGEGFCGMFIHYPDDGVTAALLVNAEQFPRREFLERAVVPFLR